MFGMTSPMTSGRGRWSRRLHRLDTVGERRLLPVGAELNSFVVTVWVVFGLRAFDLADHQPAVTWGFILSMRRAT